MREKFFILLLLVSVPVFSFDEKATDEWKTARWQLNVLLKSESVYGGAVQFALLDYDPGDDFRKQYFRIMVMIIQKEKDYDIDRDNVNLTVSWDIEFRNVKGHELYILFRNDLIVLSSSMPEKKYYVVTKTAMINDRPCVWIIPVTGKTGTEQDVILDDSNAVYLDVLSAK